MHFWLVKLQAGRLHHLFGFIMAVIMAAAATLVVMGVPMGGSRSGRLCQQRVGCPVGALGLRRARQQHLNDVPVLRGRSSIDGTCTHVLLLGIRIGSSLEIMPSRIIGEYRDPRI